jgi:hypothetical protein
MKIDWNRRDVSIRKVENGYLLGKRSRGFSDTAEEETFFATPADLVLKLLRLEDEKSGSLVATHEDVREIMTQMAFLHSELCKKEAEKLTESKKEEEVLFI